MAIPYNPHSYQARGIELLVGGNGGLLLDPGMGKTVTAIAAFNILRRAGYVKRMLVIAPIKPMYDTWPKECLKWIEYMGMRVSILHGAKKAHRLKDDADIYVINPEGLTWLSGQRWTLPDVLCVDESTKFKTSTSKRFKLLKKMLGEFRYRWIMTGTVAPQGLIDLFGQIYILDTGARLGKYITHYRNRYFQQEGFGGYTWTPYADSMDTITHKIKDIVLSLEAEDYLEMPEFMEIDRYVELPPEVMVKYREVERDFISQLEDGTIIAANAGAAGAKCRQIANGACYTEGTKYAVLHDKKIEAMDEVLEETLGHPVLILYEFRHDRDRIMTHLKGEAVCITGVTGTKLNTIVDKFNVGEIKYLVAHPGSLHGMNIQGTCFHMIWFCITWKLEDYIQAIWRLYRQGQTSNMVMCYRLISANTRDEAVAAALAHKGKVQDDIDRRLGC